MVTWDLAEWGICISFRASQDKRSTDGLRLIASLKNIWKVKPASEIETDSEKAVPGMMDDQ